MEGDLVLIHLIAKLSSKSEKLQREQILRTIRDANDLFAHQDTIFIQFFRFPKTLCWDIIQELKPHDSQPTSLPFVIRFLSVLYFLAHGSYRKCVGNYNTISLSQATISRNITFICKLIFKVKGNVIRFPITNEECVAKKISFFNRFCIKGTIGAIGCTDIPLLISKATADGTPAHVYMNRKGFYSLNVEAICDYDLRFLHVNAKFPGSCHDSEIWTTSNIRIHLIQNHNTSESKRLLGDSGYPLEPWLLTPINEPSTQKEATFNTLHTKARNVIDLAFGVLKSRFRCLSNDAKLQYGHERVAYIYITYACTILHNILQEKRIFVDETEIVVKSHHGTEPITFEIEPSDFLPEGKRLRQAYINSLAI